MTNICEMTGVEREEREWTLRRMQELKPAYDEMRRLLSRFQPNPYIIPQYYDGIETLGYVPEESCNSPRTR